MGLVSGAVGTGGRPPMAHGAHKYLPWWSFPKRPHVTSKDIAENGSTLLGLAMQLSLHCIVVLYCMFFYP